MKRALWNLAMKAEAFVSTSGAPTQWQLSSSLGLTLLGGLYFGSLSSSSSVHLKQKQEETLPPIWFTLFWVLLDCVLNKIGCSRTVRGQWRSFIAGQGFWANGGGGLTWCVAKGWWRYHDKSTLHAVLCFLGWPARSHSTASLLFFYKFSYTKVSPKRCGFTGASLSVTCFSWNPVTPVRLNQQQEGNLSINGKLPVSSVRQKLKCCPIIWKLNWNRDDIILLVTKDWCLYLIPTLFPSSRRIILFHVNLNQVQ